MTKAQLEKNIIRNIKDEMELFPEYNNYTFVTAIKDAISKAMYGTPITSGVIYYFGEGYGKGKHATDRYRKQLITEEEIAKVEKVYSAMLQNGYLTLSKNGKLAKLVKEI